MEYIPGNDRSQMQFFALEELVAQDSWARIIDLFVDILYRETENFWRFDTVRINHIKVIMLDASPIQLKDVVIKGERETYKRGDTLIIPVIILRPNHIQVLQN